MSRRVAILLAAVLLLAHGTLWSRLYSTDDAFIGYRYAENAAAGLGLVWNAGEPVEGYTNFLWTVLLSAVARTGLDLPSVAPWLGLACALATLLLAPALARRMGAGPWAPAAAGLLALAGPMALWSSSGMETPLFGLLLTAAFLLLLGEGRGSLPAAGALFGLAALTRPEGILVGALALAAVWIWSRGDPGARGASPRPGLAVLAGGLLLAAPVAMHLGWRLHYYGAWLPNTFYAKSGGSLATGWRYLGSHLWGTLPLYALALTALLRGGRRLLPVLVPLPAFLVYVVWTGGDWMPAHRFLAPLLPLLSAAAAAGLGHLGLRRLGGSRILQRGALALAALWLGVGAALLVVPAARRHAGPDVLIALGRHLRETAPADGVIAVVPAGKIPYYSRLRAIDMRGLCDVHIARTTPPPGEGLPGHFKRDPDHVLARHPDYIITTGAKPKPGKAPKGSPGPFVLDAYPIQVHREFRRWYEPVLVELPEGGKDLQYFRRRRTPREP